MQKQCRISSKCKWYSARATHKHQTQCCQQNYHAKYFLSHIRQQSTTNSDKDALNLIMQTSKNCRLDYGNAWELGPV